VAKKSTPKKTTAQKAGKKANAKRPAEARRGDAIVVDSPQVGSPPREGEVLSVTHGSVTVSYRVRWADGHESLITPSAGSLTVIRS
jgi:Domain of unknown function (DUF1918)